MIRVLWLVPRLGSRSAELLEMPLMVLVSFVAAKWIVRRSSISYSANERIAIGLVALLFMIGAELSISGVVTKRDPIAGLAYGLALLLFASMPFLIGARKATAGRTTSIDAFIAGADVSECHEILVHAPAKIVFEVAEQFDIRSIPTVNAIFRLRELAYRAQPPDRTTPIGLVAETMSLGWGTLAYRPGEELVMGAVTQPWVGDVKFRSVPPEAFSKFSEPGFVKIAWTLEVDSIGPEATRFRTQTRVLATDPASRRKFRLYWVFAGPFIVLIRRLVNRAVRQRAESRASRHASTLPRFT